MSNNLSCWNTVRGDSLWRPSDKKLSTFVKVSAFLTNLILPPRTPKDFTATVVGFSGGLGGCQLLVQDKNVVIANGTQVDITGNALSFISEQSIPQAALYELTGAGPSYTFTLTPQLIRDTKGAQTNLTFMHIASGAWVTSQVTVGANLQPQGQTLIGQGQN